MARMDAMRRQRWSMLARLTVFVVVTGLLTVFVAMQIAKVNLSGGWKLSATFEDASGLSSGDEVKIAGATVGQVDDVKVVKGRARVDFTVDHGISVPADSEAAIRWRDALGSRVIYLVPGTSAAKMRPGTHITRTRSVVDSGELLAQLEPLTKSLKPEQVNQLMGSLAEGLDGNGGNIDRLVIGVDRLSSTIAARRATLKQMIDDYTVVTDVLARRDAQIAQAVDDLATLSQAFTDNQRLIDQVLVELAKTSTTADAVLAGNGRELDEVITRLAGLTAGTRRNSATLLKVFQNAGPRVRHIFEATNDGHFLDSAAVCVNVSGPPCPFGMKLPAGRAPEPVNTPKALQRLMIGGE